MISYLLAKDKILKEHKDSYVHKIYDAESFWIVSLCLKKLKPGEYMLDAFFSVDKNSGKIAEYSPVMNPNEFKKALKKIVYTGEK